MIALLASLAIFLPCDNGYYCQQPPPWNGQLQETWNTPGLYGGWGNGPRICDPRTLQCAYIAIP